MNGLYQKKTASECLKHTFLENKFYDMILTFERKDRSKQLQAHKVVLAMRSPVFEAMLYGPLANKETDICLQEDDYESFKLMLEYMYMDDVRLTGETVLKCLYTANKYCFEEFVEYCSNFLEKYLSSANVCTVFEQAKFYVMKELQERCFNWILDNAEEVFASEDFLELSYETLILLLDSNRLGSNEITVFTAALHWAKYQCKSNSVGSSPCNLRDVLGEALYKIRFPLIPVEELTDKVVPVGLLTVEEHKMILQCQQIQETARDNSAIRFVCEKRKERRFNIEIQKAEFGDEVISMYGIPPPNPELILEFKTSAKLHELRGDFLKHVVNVFLIEQELVGDLINFRKAKRPLNTEDWQLGNDFIIFAPPIYLNGQHIIAFEHLKNETHPTFHIKHDKRRKQETSIIDCVIHRIPEDIDAIVVSE